MDTGRFPSHLLLSHALECTEAECVVGCPVMALDSQSGIRKSGGRVHTIGEVTPNHGIYNPHVYSKHTEYQASEGGASRYFQQFRPTPESPRGALLQYLTRLITPPGGIVLDPFSSSDDLQEACQAEGFTFIAIKPEE